METFESEPHLSVVAVSRNDDHGGNMLERMQHFIDGFLGQCRRHHLAAELIVVEWNPPEDRPPLAEALMWPDEIAPAMVRLVTVPREIHARLEHSKALPLFQMIGKNVGIRRARGRFILATNMDILMNDALICYMRDCLKPNTLFRVDRFDVPENLPRDQDFGKVMAFCNANFIRIATRHGIFKSDTRSFLGHEGNPFLQRIAKKYARTLWPEMRNREVRRLRAVGQTVVAASVVIARALQQIPWLLSKLLPPKHIPVRAYWLGHGIVRCVLDACHRLLQHNRVIGQLWLRIIARQGIIARHEGVLARLHTHACGDFTLLAREDWLRVRGYPEWPMYSWHIDSVFMCLAAASGVRQVALPLQYRIYHIEHDAGSGWMPEAEEQLFARLRARNIPYLTLEELKEWGRRCARHGSPCFVNQEDWGFGDLNLPERVIRPCSPPSRALPVAYERVRKAFRARAP